MFTPKNIQGALEELYDLCDPDYMVDMLVNYSEEFDDISPALLAKSFQKNAEMISEYRVLSSAGEGIDYQGKVLLNSRAVRLLSYVEDMSGDEKVRTIQSKELWLAEDMTFYVVSCMSTITMDKEEAICLNEHRSVVTTVECEDDIFFDMGSLICELDDICLFELLADVDATVTGSWMVAFLISKETEVSKLERIRCEDHRNLGENGYGASRISRCGRGTG